MAELHRRHRCAGRRPRDSAGSHGAGRPDGPLLRPAVVSGPFNVDDLPDPTKEDSIKAEVGSGGGRNRPTLSSVEPAPADSPE